ncbi:MAG TPA: hypothetical protein DCX07_15835 [Phycisphaerales bacterium]|nr:hypothetical protein [Phycisphaerales bacterium]
MVKPSTSRLTHIHPCAVGGDVCRFGFHGQGLRVGLHRLVRFPGGLVDQAEVVVDRPEKQVGGQRGLEPLLRVVEMVVMDELDGLGLSRCWPTPGMTVDATTF